MANEEHSPRRLRAIIACDHLDPGLWWPMVVEERDVAVTFETSPAWVGTKPMQILDAGSEAFHQLQRLEAERRVTNERPDGG